MHRIVLSALLLLLLTASPALADNARGLVAVLELKNKLHGSEKEQVDEAYLTDLVRSQVLEQGRGLRVMTRENIVVLLQSQGKKLADCEGECEVDTGRRLGADYIISGEVLKFGTALKVNLKLHETHDGQLLAGAQASGTTVDELDHNTAASVGRLLAPLRGEAPGAEPVAERPSAPSPAPVPASPARPTTPPADSAAEQRAAEQRKAEQRTAEQRAAQQRAVEQRAVAQRPPEPAPQSKPQAADASARPASESAGQAGLELRVAPFLASASTFSLKGVGFGVRLGYSGASSSRVGVVAAAGATLEVSSATFTSDGNNISQGATMLQLGQGRRRSRGGGEVMARSQSSARASRDGARRPSHAASQIIGVYRPRRLDLSIRE